MNRLIYTMKINIKELRAQIAVGAPDMKVLRQIITCKSNNQQVRKLAYKEYLRLLLKK